MTDYVKMYQLLLIASERAIAMLDQGKAEEARLRLIEGELRAENVYIETCDGETKPETGADRRAQIDAAFTQFPEQERAALQWLAEHRTVMEKAAVGEKLTDAEMFALIEATAEHGVYSLYYIHMRKTELDDDAAYAAAKHRAGKRAAAQQNE